MPTKKLKTSKALAEREPAAPRTSYSSALLQDGNRWQLMANEGAPVQAPSLGLVPAVENAIAIINYINSNPPHSFALADLTKALTISKSHCHSVLRTLAHVGWLKYDARSRCYELNGGLVASSSSFLGSPALDRIRHVLLELVNRIGIPAVLVQPQPDDSFIVVDKFNGAASMEFAFPIGHHYPRDATANMRAYLAWQSQGVIDEWMRKWQPVRYTSTTLVSEEAVRAEIAATRKRGYARSVGEHTEGLMAIGMPVFGRHGEVIYVFTCSGLISVLAPREDYIANEVVRAAIEINRSIMGRVPADFPA